MSELDAGDAARPVARHATRSDRQILLGLAGGSFALQSLLLTSVSITASVQTDSAAVTAER